VDALFACNSIGSVRPARAGLALRRSADDIKPATTSYGPGFVEMIFGLAGKKVVIVILLLRLGNAFGRLVGKIGRSGSLACIGQCCRV